MREKLKDYLFSKGYLVSDARYACDASAETIVSLAKLFGIRVTSHPELAQLDMVRVAARNLGESVPAPFYQGFPQSVRELSANELLLDQILHYVRTYGLGDFGQAGHSVFERNVERLCFSEKTEVKEYAIVSEKEAEQLLAEAASTMLASSRPLSDASYAVLLAIVREYDYPVTECPCKDTVVRLVIDTRDVAFARLLALPDVLRLVETIQCVCYDSKEIRKLNLRNRDRKLIVAVLDAILSRDGIDIRTCLERRRVWCGLLHHLHYRPKTGQGSAFVRAIRTKEQRSAWSAFEQRITAGDVRGATSLLNETKGAGAVLRNLDYLLSRCTCDEDVSFVLDSVESTNKIVLIQLLIHYALYEAELPRTFAFAKLGTLRVHTETPKEAGRRKSALAPSVIAQASARVHELLQAVCKPTLGKVFLPEELRRMAIPLQMAAAQEGVATLPSGSRLPLPTGKTLRAFTYWELVDDIDLSVVGLTESGEQIEFSWRTMSAQQNRGIVFSGDQTSGFAGGSEYYDIEPDTFVSYYPNIHYLVFCNNVFSGVPFSNCFCTAGYMLRDEADLGEVFEPKTVESSFGVTCTSTFAYLFAIDLVRREFIWLNIARSGSLRVAGESRMGSLIPKLRVTEALSLYDFARLHATEEVAAPEDAQTVLGPRDYDWALRLLND